jgi:hypothetical protein
LVLAVTNPVLGSVSVEGKTALGLDAAVLKAGSEKEAAIVTVSAVGTV